MRKLKIHSPIDCIKYDNEITDLTLDTHSTEYIWDVFYMFNVFG